MKSTQEITQEVRDLGQWIPALRQQVGHVVIGQKYLVDRLLLGLLANGHLLLEGVPGLAKTLTVKTMASGIQTGFQRLQFTPDLLPADLIGTLIYNPRTGEFTTKAWTHLFEFNSGRRNQSRAGQSSERLVGSDAGTAGHNRRTNLSASRSVPGSCHSKPNRTGRHLPTA